MFLLLWPNSLIDSSGLYPSPGHRTTIAVVESANTTDGSGSIGLFLVMLFHNCFTE